MVQLIELEIYQGVGDTALHKKVSINPEYIVFIEDDGDHAFVHMANKSILHTVESREQILQHSAFSTVKEYIK